MTAHGSLDPINKKSYLNLKITTRHKIDVTDVEYHDSSQIDITDFNTMTYHKIDVTHVNTMTHIADA
jgi:hypothetical protein